MDRGVWWLVRQAWDFVDAWMLASIGPSEKTVPLRSVARAADHYNHALFSAAEAASALSNLASAGLVEVSGSGVRLTEAGIRMWKKASPHSGFELVEHFLDLLGDITYVGGPRVLSDEAWIAAVQARRRGVWQWIRRSPGKGHGSDPGTE